MLGQSRLIALIFYAAHSFLTAMIKNLCRLSHFIDIQCVIKRDTFKKLRLSNGRIYRWDSYNVYRSIDTLSSEAWTIRLYEIGTRFLRETSPSAEAQCHSFIRRPLSPNSAITVGSPRNLEDREGRSLIRSLRTIRSIPLRKALRRGLLRKNVRGYSRSCTRSRESFFPTGLRKHPREQRRREPPRFRYARSDDRERRAGTGCARSYRHPRTSARTGSAG